MAYLWPVVIVVFIAAAYISYRFGYEHGAGVEIKSQLGRKHSYALRRANQLLKRIDHENSWANDMMSWMNKQGGNDQALRQTLANGLLHRTAPEELRRFFQRFCSAKYAARRAKKFAQWYPEGRLGPAYAVPPKPFKTLEKHAYLLNRNLKTIVKAITPLSSNLKASGETI